MTASPPPVRTGREDWITSKLADDPRALAAVLDGCVRALADVAAADGYRLAGPAAQHIGLDMPVALVSVEARKVLGDRGILVREPNMLADVDMPPLWMVVTVAPVAPVTRPGASG